MTRRWPALFLLLAASSLRAATYQVTTVNDSGAGSFRQAVADANANPGADLITFNIATAPPHAIALASPVSVTDGVTIDGSTDPDLTITGAAITLAPGSDLSLIDRLSFSAAPSSAGLVIQSGGNEVVRSAFRCATGSCNGIVIEAGSANLITQSSFGPIDGTGISIRAGDGNIVEDNFIVSSTRGVQVILTASNTIIRDNVIGQSGERNDIGVMIDGPPGTIITNNTIEFNGTGVHGTSTIRDNWITDNELGISGVTANLTVNGNYILRNIHGINLARTGNGEIRDNEIAFNSGDGIHDDRSGGTYTTDGNVIYDNGGNGVAVTFGGTMSITHNIIDGNGLLGIDLRRHREMDIGVTPNDPGDADLGGNGLQNYPVLESAQTTNTSTIITGTLSSTPSSSFTLEFFAVNVPDPSGHGESSQFLGEIDVTTDANGESVFAGTLAWTAAGSAVTALATGADGTSEFAANIIATSSPPLPAALRITKTASPETVHRSAPMTFTIAVTNDGPGAAQNVVITDALPAGMTASVATSSRGSCIGTTTVVCTLGNIANGNSATVTIYTTSPPNDGVYSNTARASGNNAPEVTAQAAFRVARGGADVYALLDAPASAPAGSEVTIHATLGNIGPEDATAARLVISGATVTGVDSTMTCAIAGSMVTCDAGALAPGAARTADVRVQLTEDVVVVQAHAESNTNDPDPSNNDATATVDTRAADIEASLDATPLPVRTGQTFLLTVVALNRGPGTAEDLTLRFTLPPELTLVHAPNACTGTRDITCLGGTLAAGESVTLRLEIRAPREVGTFPIALDVAEERVTVGVPVMIPRRRTARH